MAAGDISLNILIGATDNASGVIAGLAGGGALGSVAVAALGAGTALVGFGVASVSAAANFQQGMTTLVTGAGESASALGMVSQGILTMSVATGTSTQQLTSGMYMIESAGFHGAAGLQVLQAAAEGAKVGNADLGTVANATTTIMTDFGISSQNSSQAVNTLIATVANGKTTMGDLSGALSQVAPTAAVAGISLTDMMGAMATMTGEGVPAANAATFLRQTIIALDTPSKQTVSALQAVGLSSTDVANELKVSLPGALQMITDAVGKKFPVGSAAYVNALKNIAGGSKQMQGILDLTGVHLATFKQNVDNISLAVQKGGGSILGWTAVQGDFNTQMDRAKASVAALFIVVGTQLLPVLTPIVSQIANVVAGFTQWITTGGQLSPMLQNIAGMFGIMGTNWGQFIAQLQSTLSGPLTQFGQLMGSLLPGFITQFLRALNLVQLAFITVASGAATLVGPALQILGQMFQGLQGAIEIVLNALEGQFLPALQNLVSALAPTIAAILQWVASSGLVPALWAAIGAVLGTVIGVMSGLMNGLASIINFLRQNAAGAALLAVAIGALAGIMTLFAVASVAKTILSLIQFGISMATAAAETVTSATTMITTFGTMSSMMIASLGEIVVSTLAVAAPFLIIGAIIAVVVVGIILVIKNWGTIGPWLQGIWSGVVSFFQAAMTQIGQAVSAVVAWFNQWKTPIMIVGGAILTFLAPALIQAGVQAVVAGAQIAAGFIASLIETGTQAVIAGAQVAASFVTSLITAGAQAVVTGAQFVTSLIPAIISFATEAIVTAATAIPAMIAGFISWAIAGWAAAAATIAATWPVLLIIVAIAALVAIIILLVTHWGQVVSFLQSTWNAFTAWFMSALSALGAFFQSVWNAIVAFFQGVWNGIIAFLQAAWNTIVNIVQTAINTVVGWFVWLYAHNYYFQDLVDFIVNVFTFLSSAISAIWTAITSFLSATWTAITQASTAAWNAIAAFLQATWNAITAAITAAWNAISAFLQATWNAISSATIAAWNAITAFLQGVWNAISGAVTAAWNAILGAIQAAWAAISGAVMAAANAVMVFLQGVWNSIVSTVTGMWGQISGIFGSAWGTYIAGPLGGLANSIAGWFTGLVGQATQWGANLLQGFINGLLSMLSNLGTAVGQILGVIAKLLGFHSPTKEGEGRFITEWGKNMVKGFGQGIEAATPMLHAQIEHLIQPPKLSYAKAAGSAFALSTSPVVHVHIEPGETKIHLDKREVGHAVMNFAAREVRTQGGVRSR